jgi:hypothetical protein
MISDFGVSLPKKAQEIKEFTNGTKTNIGFYEPAIRYQK